jgi:hypothetical protein
MTLPHDLNIPHDLDGDHTTIIERRLSDYRGRPRRHGPADLRERRAGSIPRRRARQLRASPGGLAQLVGLRGRANHDAGLVRRQGRHGDGHQEGGQGEGDRHHRVLRAELVPGDWTYAGLIASGQEMAELCKGLWALSDATRQLLMAAVDHHEQLLGKVVAVIGQTELSGNPQVRELRDGLGRDQDAALAALHQRMNL